MYNFFTLQLWMKAGGTTMKFDKTTHMLAACCLSLSGPLFAATLEVDVKDAQGNALTDAAIYAEPLAGALPSRPRPAEIEQKNRKFMPLMTVVQTGSEIAFPNNDTVRHHVYSFSPAKPFELKLYSGTPGNPVLFDKPGTVVIGCNIHDRMVAYIQVVNTPFFGKTGDTGKVRIADLPAGKYKLKAWHPQLLMGATMPEQEISIGKHDAAVSISLNPAADTKPR